MLMEAWEPIYSELVDEYSEYFSLSGIEGTFDDKVGLVSLICFLTQSARKKNPDATCWQVIMKITKEPTDKHYLKFLRGLSIVCNDFMKHTTKFNNMGLKTSKEMVEKINSILDLWLPF